VDDPISSLLSAAVVCAEREIGSGAEGMREWGRLGSISILEVEDVPDTRSLTKVPEGFGLTEDNSCCTKI
jgi:hypothetical protein